MSGRDGKIRIFPSVGPRAANGSLSSKEAYLSRANGLGRHQEVRRDHSRAAQLELLEGCLEKARGLLPQITTPQELLELATALAIVIDKRRLLEGEVLDRLEVRVSRPRGRLARIAARLAAGAGKGTLASRFH